MKMWCYVKTADGYEGFVQVDKNQPLGDQVSDRAAVIVYDPAQKYQAPAERNGSFFGYLALLIVVLLVMTIFG